MKRPAFIITLATLMALPRVAEAQRITADIRIADGPVAGHLFLGEPYPSYGHRVVTVYPTYRRPAVREIVVYRAHRGYGWWRHHDYHAVRVWYDRDRDTYYNRFYDGRNLRAVVLYERDGRYYHDDDCDRDDYYDRDRGYHRDDGYHRDRY